jgi:hypothetical protein
LCAPHRSRENKNAELCRAQPEAAAGSAAGEHAITVLWCERDPSAADDRKLRVTFKFVYDPMAEVTVVNASEIRFELSGADLPKVPAAPIRACDPGPAEALAIARGSSAAEHAAAVLNKPRLSEKLLRRSSRFIRRAPSSSLRL